MKSVFLHKSHNVTVLMYHLVLPAKYRKSVITKEVDKNLVECCNEIEKRYKITFLEIGTDKNHVYFLVQASPTYSPTKIVTIIKSITARYIFQKNQKSRNSYGEENFGQTDILQIQLVNIPVKMQSQSTYKSKVKKASILN